MKKTLRKKFILFAMSAVTVLLVVLIGAINILNWVILDRQSDAVLHSLSDVEGKFGQMDRKNKGPFLPDMDMDTIQSARFFTVRLDDTGRVLDVNIDQISSVTKEQAEAYAGELQDSSGKLDGYKYQVRQMGPDRLVFFMDTSSQIRNFLMVLTVSTAIGLLCWILILPFVILLSGRVVRPVLAGMEKQKQFITNAGHELKTPLAIIQTNNDASTLIYGENKYSKNIRQQTQRLNGLMTNLLTLAKLDEEGKLPTEPVNVSELIQTALPAYEDLSQQKGVGFVTDIAPNIWMQVHADTFSQMIFVLLDNAVKYTPGNGDIRLTLSREGEHILLWEENTCETSPDVDPERLFERFYRGDSARTQDGHGGYGIGLSAARAIVEAFGGVLRASYPDRGHIRFLARF